MKDSGKNHSGKTPKKIKDLTGLISLPEDFDYKKAISQYLWEKYLHLNN